MTNLFKTYDEYKIESKLSREKIVSILKSYIHLNESTFYKVLQPHVGKKYFGVFSYPDKFLIKSSTNLMTSGLNIGTVTEIEIREEESKCILSFKVNNINTKMIFIIIALGLIVLSLIGLFLIDFSLSYYFGILILVAIGFYRLGYLIINSMLKEQKKYFEKIIKTKNTAHNTVHIA